MWVSVSLFQMSMKRPSAPDDDTWKTPSSHDLLKIYEETKSFAVQFKQSFVVKTKIIATEKGKPAAESLVEFFTYCKWEMEVNHEGGSYIFPSSRPFKGALIKFRASNPYLSVARQVFHPVSIFAELPKTENFPESDAFNFIQIEIGDSPRNWREN